jgi:hypothetical protein
MDTRGAKLVALPAFAEALQRCSGQIAALEHERLEDQTLDPDAIAGMLWVIIERLRLTETHARLVTGTKALHHLLPNLVVPMDRQFTGAFFGWHNQAWQAAQERSFKTAFASFVAIAREARPSRYVASGWNTSPTKVLDNAIVGYCRKHDLDRASYERALIARAKELGIYDEILAEVKRRPS